MQSLAVSLSDLPHIVNWTIASAEGLFDFSTPHLYSLPPISTIALPSFSQHPDFQESQIVAEHQTFMRIFLT